MEPARAALRELASSQSCMLIERHACCKLEEWDDTHRVARHRSLEVGNQRSIIRKLHSRCAPANERFESLIRAVALYAADTACPIHYEPSGADFLSPCLAEADLMRRVYPAAEFANWLDRFLSIPTEGDWLSPAVVSDRSDPHIVHLDGLNLSRAWMKGCRYEWTQPYVLPARPYSHWLGSPIL